MKINHHPSDALLMDYAAGSLHEAWSLGIATHLALCPDCRQHVENMECIGGDFLENHTPCEMTAGAKDKALAVIDALTSDHPPSIEVNPRERGGILPEPLRSYVGGDVEALAWKRLGVGAYQFVVPTREHGVTARLLRIPAGRPVPEHGHRGLELTLVLQGAFSDQTGDYRRGDLEEADQSIDHQPLAAPGEDCICLAITDAPLRFSSLAARMAQPFIRI